MEFIYDDGGRSKYYKAESVGDCAVRAISIAMNRDYKIVYDDLKRLNDNKSCRNGTPNSVIRKYLIENDWKWVATMKFGQGCKVHLCSEELPENETLIVSVSKHLTCVKNSILYDTYDCSRNGRRCVYGYYIKK